MYFAGKFHGDWPLYVWITVSVITVVAVVAAVAITRRCAQACDDPLLCP